MKLIDLSELELRISKINHPTPFDVLDIISQMYKELKNDS